MYAAAALVRDQTGLGPGVLDDGHELFGHVRVCDHDLFVAIRHHHPETPPGERRRRRRRRRERFLKHSHSKKSPSERQVQANP